MVFFIKLIFGIFWFVSALFLGYLIYIVFVTESNSSLIWAWSILCSFTFIGATFLSYLVLFSAKKKEENE